MAIWNAAPDRFVNPFISEIRFGFICGCGHSGTTLISAKLGAHSAALLIGRETNAFSPVFGAYCSRRIVAEWVYFAEAMNKDLIIEKTPKHIQSVAKIRRLLPDSKILVTLRNPLDNIASLHYRFGNLEGAISRWLVDNRRVLELLGQDHVQVVRFEDLTTDPAMQLRKCLDFFGLDWEPGLLELTESGYDLIQQKGNMAIRTEQVRKPITRNIGGWNNIFTAPEAEKVVRKTKKLADALGYPDPFNIGGMGGELAGTNREPVE